VDGGSRHSINAHGRRSRTVRVVRPLVPVGLNGRFFLKTQLVSRKAANIFGRICDGGNAQGIEARWSRNTSPITSRIFKSTIPIISSASASVTVMSKMSLRVTTGDVEIIPFRIEPRRASCPSA
jgi:hypothetical protein